MGPLLFSLALQPILTRMKAVSVVELVIGYLDDVVVAGDDTAVSEALQILQLALEDFEFNPICRRAN